MSKLKFLYNLILKDVVKESGQASGILSIGKDVRKLADKKFQSYITAAQKQGVDLNKLSEQELKYTLELNKPKPIRAISADSPEGQGITRDLFNMLDRRSGKNVIKKDFGKPFSEEIITNKRVITDIKKLEPIEAMKEANKVLKGEGRYKNLSKTNREKIVNDESVTDHIFERDIPIDPEDMADGGVAGLLGERQNFAMGKRAFLKLMGGVGAGIAGLKSGLLGLGKGGAKKAVTETVKQAAGSGTPPPYFFKLVEKIKTLGDDVTKKSATQEREVVTRYKDFELTENIATGEKTIQRMKIDNDLKYNASEYYGKPVGEEVYMNYKPGKGQIDETTKGKTPPDEYTEDTSLIRSDKPAEGEVMDTFDGVPDDILDDILGEVGETIVKKADGGRIGFKFGSGKGILSVKGILQFLKNLKIKQSGDNVKDFVDKRQFLKNMVGNTEKNKKARELKMLKEAVDEARKKGGFKFPSKEQIKIDLEKKIQPILNKGRKLNATGGLANMLGE